MRVARGADAPTDVRLLVAVNTRSSPLEGDLKGIAEDSRWLEKLVEDKGWWHPGHGDYGVTLETYRFCESDGQYHVIDQYGQLGPAVVKILQVMLQMSPAAVLLKLLWRVR